MQTDTVNFKISSSIELWPFYLQHFNISAVQTLELHHVRTRRHGAPELTSSKFDKFGVSSCTSSIQEVLLPESNSLRVLTPRLVVCMYDSN